MMAARATAQHVAFCLPTDRNGNTMATVCRCRRCTMVTTTTPKTTRTQRKRLDHPFARVNKNLSSFCQCDRFEFRPPEISETRFRILLLCRCCCYDRLLKKSESQVVNVRFCCFFCSSFRRSFRVSKSESHRLQNEHKWRTEYI